MEWLGTSGESEGLKIGWRSAGSVAEITSSRMTPVVTPRRAAATRRRLAESLLMRAVMASQSSTLGLRAISHPLLPVGNLSRVDSFQRQDFHPFGTFQC